jgi:hypothetical protein
MKREVGKYYRSNLLSVWECIWLVYSEDIDIEFWKGGRINIYHRRGNCPEPSDYFEGVDIEDVPEELLEYLRSPFLEIDIKRRLG